ncbi:MAG: hypothetical protein IT443_07225 [Phycisphaeraceae bacterium]|nr:hypothetical protein [Phycisphaeraceae bacterium]
MTRRIQLVMVVAMVIVAVWPMRAEAGLRYAVTPLYGIGTYATEALAINNAGDVVGGAFTGQIYDPMDWQIPIYNAFKWSSGSSQGTNIQGGYGYSYGVDINDAGQALIYYPYLMWSSTPPWARLTPNGINETIWANSVGAVNAQGKVVGQEDSGDSFVWQNGQKTYLALAGTDWLSVKLAGINDDGWVVGRGVTSYSGGLGRAFVQVPGEAPVELGTLGYGWASATDVSNQGVVVGGSWTGPQQSSMHAFRWTEAGGMEDLGSLGGETMAEAINEDGLVVGSSKLGTSSDSASHAFVYRDGQMIDLNSMIDPLGGWVLTGAADINELGQIVGTGIWDGQQRGFVLTPYMVTAYVPGDFNGDGVVTLSDINPFKLALTNTPAWQALYPDVPLSEVDLSGDENVTLTDVGLLIQMMRGGGLPVPEPSGLGWLVIGISALLHRRRI